MCKAGPCPRCQSTLIREVPYTRDWSYPQCWRCGYSNYRSSANSECDSWESFESTINESTEITPLIDARISLFDGAVKFALLTKKKPLDYYDYKVIDKGVRKFMAKLEPNFVDQCSLSVLKSGRKYIAIRIKGLSHYLWFERENFIVNELLFVGKDGWGLRGAFTSIECLREEIVSVIYSDDLQY